MKQNHSDMSHNPQIARFIKLRDRLGATMEGHELADCLPALLDCIESGTLCSAYPLARATTATALRQLADRLENQPAAVAK